MTQFTFLGTKNHSCFILTSSVILSDLVHHYISLNLSDGYNYHYTLLWPILPLYSNEYFLSSIYRNSSLLYHPFSNMIRWQNGQRRRSCRSSFATLRTKSRSRFQADQRSGKALHETFHEIKDFGIGLHRFGRLIKKPSSQAKRRRLKLPRYHSYWYAVSANAVPSPLAACRIHACLKNHIPT